ncbi:MAG: c-type cytochrome, partial [Planctomycetaceae bacterium]
MTRLVTAYRYIQVEPPLSTDALVEWLQSHPDAPSAVQIAALESVGLCGGAESGSLSELAARLLQHDDAAARIDAVRAIGLSGINSASGALAVALQDTQRPVEERREILQALGQLRSQPLPFTGQPSPPGVETVTDELAAVTADPQQGEIRTDALALLAQVDYAKAEPIALTFLDSEATAVVAAAINALASRPERAKEIGRRFVAGTIDRALLPRVAEALRRHAEKDESGEFKALLNEVFKGGLLVSLDPQEVQRVESLVEMTGDPERGRAVYLDKQRTQCATCHKLEGVGGQIGPDLSKVYETHTVAKILESMLDPSKEIKEGYATWTAVTKSGQVYNGLKISETGQELVLRDSTGKDIRLKRDEIEEIIQSAKSLMPDGVVSQLSFQEFIDLVAFLKDRESQQRLKETA